MFRSKIIPATRATLSRSTYRFAAAPSAVFKRSTSFTRDNHNAPQNDGHNWPKVASDVVWWGGIVDLAYVMTHPFL